MTSLGRTLVALVLLVGLTGCAEEAPRAPDAEPGIFGTALQGRLEVRVVDEATRSPLASTVEVVGGDGRTIDTASGDGPFIFVDAMLVPPLTIRVTGSTRPQALVGLAGARAVIAVQRERSQLIEGRVLGAAAHGASEVVVGAVAPVSFVRTDALARGAAVPCVVGADGCSFRIENASLGSDTIVATLHDAAGLAIGFGITSVTAGSTELLLPTTTMPTISLVVPPTLAPPAGLSAVVGVPGLSTPSGVVFLTQMASTESRITVPDLTTIAGNPSWWILAEARGAASERSVVIQRGLRDPSAVGDWAPWLDVPGASVGVDGVVTLRPAPGATLHAIDWLAATGEVLASALVVDSSAPLHFVPDVTATSIRVRAIDAPLASAASLALGAAERTVTRFSETTIAAAVP